MEKGSRVVVTSGVFTRVNGTFESVQTVRDIFNPRSANELIAFVKVDELNTIKVAIGDIQEVSELDG
jgi:methionine salvage enolase-phosphatase E1